MGTEISIWWLVTLFLVGVVHMFSSELWLPSSIWIWRKKSGTVSRHWSAFNFNYFHVVSGALLYLIFRPILLPVADDPAMFWVFTASLLLLGVSLREIVLRKKPLWKMDGKTVLTVLGPSEILIPVLIKSESAGVSLVYPILVFALGTLISGVLLMVSGAKSWENPYDLPYEISKGPRWSFASVALTLLAFFSSFVYL